MGGTAAADERELPHDNFRRAHNDNRGMHDEWWRPYDDCIVSMAVPSTFRHQASRRREEGDEAGKDQDCFHIQFVSISERRYATVVEFAMGCNPTPSVGFRPARNFLNGSVGF